MGTRTSEASAPLKKVDRCMILKKGQSAWEWQHPWRLSYLLQETGFRNAFKSNLGYLKSDQIERIKDESASSIKEEIHDNIPIGPKSIS